MPRLRCSPGASIRSISTAAGCRVTHLDQVSKTRPVLVLHSNGHLLNVNSRILEMAGIDASTNIYGVLKDEAGKPTGELMEMAAKYMAYRQTGNPFFGGIRTPSLLSYEISSKLRRHHGNRSLCHLQ